MKVLIATDVTARGIDIQGVQFVVNYDLPDQPENYVHRVGRTGRGKDRGFAISFCSEEERAILQEIETYLTNPVKVLEIDRNNYSETIDFSADNPHDWRSLLKEEQDFKSGKKRK